MGPKELVCHQPQTVVEARFSLEFSLASAIVYGQVGLEQFTEEKIQDSRVQALMQRITMAVDEDLAKLGFIGTAPVKLWITLTDGEQIFGENDLARGNPEKPFSDDEFRDKFRNCVKGLLDEQHTEQLLSSLFNLEKIPLIDELMVSIRGC